MQYIHVNVSLIDVIRYVVKYLSLCRPLWGLRYLRKWNAYEHWQLDMCHTFISEYNNRSRQQVEWQREGETVWGRGAVRCVHKTYAEVRKKQEVCSNRRWIRRGSGRRMRRSIIKKKRTSSSNNGGGTSTRQLLNLSHLTQFADVSSRLSFVLRLPLSACLCFCP